MTTKAYTNESIGLTSIQAINLQTQYGKNLLISNKNNWISILSRQFKSSFIYLLVAAIIISTLLGERIDAIIVALFIAINATLGFIQEYRSEKTLQLLEQYTKTKANVYRDGILSRLDVRQIVPQDVIALAPGDIIPADVKFSLTQNLWVDESTLTGESAPVYKSSSNTQNLGYSGTVVTKGEATAIVTSTGKNSQLGKISELATTTKRQSAFEKSINSYSNVIIKLVVGTLILLVATNLLLKTGNHNITELLLFTIALAVSVIPEALPVVVTFSLSRGAARLAKSKVIVKRLSAIEDLGSIEILCTDKTGTLTENQLTVSKIFGSDPQNIALFASLCGQSGTDPFDLALTSHLNDAQKTKLKTYEIIANDPFDPVHRRNAVIARSTSQTQLITRGALESLLELSKTTTEETKKLRAFAAKEGDQGHRIIAIAHKHLKAPLPTSIQSAQKDLEIIGLISFVDPIKPSTFEAIKKAKNNGITVKIITGDSPEVAGHVAHTIGLIGANTQIISGRDFDSLSPQAFDQLVENTSVFARVTPQQKYAIIQSLQKQHLVGFLGEGINDAPALKIANVGLAVESASEISRESADIILLQKNLLVIIDGIKQGREVFTNTTKYLKSTLASNFGNFFAIAISSFLIPTLPMLPLQILLVNLLSDFPMIAIATDTVGHEDTAKPEKYNIRQTVMFATVLGLVSTVFDFMFFGLFYKGPSGVLQTNWFIGSILTELVFIYSMRTRYIWFKSIRPSTTILILTVVAAIATVALPYLQIGQTIFKFTPPQPSHLAIILGLVIAYFASTEVVKLTYYKYAKNSR